MKIRDEICCFQYGPNNDKGLLKILGSENSLVENLEYPLWNIKGKIQIVKWLGSAVYTSNNITTLTLSINTYDGETISITLSLTEEQLVTGLIVDFISGFDDKGTIIPIFEKKIETVPSLEKMLNEHAEKFIKQFILDLEKKTITNDHVVNYKNFYDILKNNLTEDKAKQILYELKEKAIEKCHKDCLLYIENGNYCRYSVVFGCLKFFVEL